jgi:hypothetical protein
MVHWFNESRLQDQLRRSTPLAGVATGRPWVALRHPRNREYAGDGHGVGLSKEDRLVPRPESRQRKSDETCETRKDGQSRGLRRSDGPDARIGGLVCEYIPPMPDEAPLITVSDPSRLQAVDIAASGAGGPPFRVRDHQRWGALFLGLLVLGAALLITQASQRRDKAEERASALDFSTESRGYDNFGVANHPKENRLSCRWCG